MKYDEKNVIGLTINTSRNILNIYTTYIVMEKALMRLSTKEKIHYNHSTTANQLNSGVWIVVLQPFKIYELW